MIAGNGVFDKFLTFQMTFCFPIRRQSLNIHVLTIYICCRFLKVNRLPNRSDWTAWLSFTLCGVIEQAKIWHHLKRQCQPNVLENALQDNICASSLLHWHDTIASSIRHFYSSCMNINRQTGPQAWSFITLMNTLPKEYQLAQKIKKWSGTSFDTTLHLHFQESRRPEARFLSCLRQPESKMQAQCIISSASLCEFCCLKSVLMRCRVWMKLNYNFPNVMYP